MEKVKKYYSLEGKDEHKKSGIAYAPENAPLGFELIAEIENLNEIPFILTLRKGELQDYLPNSLAWPLMSEKMKNIIEDNISKKEGVDWIKTKVKVNDKILNYYILRFNKLLDVLDFNKSIFVQGTDHIIKPCYAKEKIKDFEIFYKPTLSWQITLNIYVSEQLKNKINQQGITGVCFEKTCVI